MSNHACAFALPTMNFYQLLNSNQLLNSITNCLTPTGEVNGRSLRITRYKTLAACFLSSSWYGVKQLVEVQQLGEQMRTLDILEEFGNK
jgi:hypothetical protein